MEPYDHVYVPWLPVRAAVDTINSSSVLPRTDCGAVCGAATGCGSSGANGVHTWQIHRPPVDESEKKKSKKKKKKKKKSKKNDEL
jgi:hypothetical protein